jgi:hypothetical protein
MLWSDSGRWPSGIAGPTPYVLTAIRQRWLGAGDLAPVFHEHLALVVTARARFTGAMCSIVWPWDVMAVSRSLVGEALQPCHSALQ